MEASVAVPTLERDVAARELALDFLCSACGYGIAPRTALPEACPMCRASTWVPLLRPGLGERDVGLVAGPGPAR